MTLKQLINLPLIWLFKGLTLADLGVLQYWPSATAVRADKYTSLGSLYMLEGRPEEARRCFLVALVLRSRAPARRSSSVKVLYGLAHAYWQLERPERTAFAYRRILRDYKDLDEKAQLARVEIMEYMAEQYRARAQYDRAEQSLLAALAWYETKFGEGSHQAATTLCELGGLLIEAEEYERAEEHLMRAASIKPADSEIREPLITVFFYLGQLYGCKERYAESESWYEKAIATVESCPVINQVRLAENLYGLAVTQIDGGKIAEARKTCERALELLVTSFGETASRVAAAHYLLGRITRQGGELDLAEQHYRRAIAIFQQIGPVAVSRKEYLLAQLADLYVAEEKLVEADETYSLLAASARAASAPVSDDTMSALEDYSKLLVRMGKPEKAEAMRQLASKRP